MPAGEPEESGEADPRPPAGLRVGTRFGVRGALDAPLPGSQGDLFVAGVYDRKTPDRPYSELEFQGRGDDPYRELASAPFPFRLRLVVEGTPLDLAGPHWREHRRVLDLRGGTLHGQAVYVMTEAGTWSVEGAEIRFLEPREK